MTLLVSEIHQCWQGEGPSAGRRATMVRLHGCNLACSWCDTPWTWDPERPDPLRPGFDMSVDEVLRRIGDAKLVIVSGGEPLLQTDALGDLVMRACPIEVETNGTRPPPRWAEWVDWNVSPKLANAGRASHLHKGWRDVPTARFKFVCRTADDVDEVTALGLPPGRVWVMPEGVTEDTVLAHGRAIASAAERRGFNLTLRQHVLLFGDEAGR